MNLKTIPYIDYEKELPQEGHVIVGQEEAQNIIVYQAFNPNIASYAVKHQKFGGDYYRFTRMSWIKPNFLWMMYRAGWAMKSHQQRILAMRLPKENFEDILAEAVHTSFKAHIYPTPEDWKSALASSNVRLQWDPDHDPTGQKLARRAIQLGLKGDMLLNFAANWIVGIEDITPFVHEQKANLDRSISELWVPYEQVIPIEDEALRRRLDLT